MPANLKMQMNALYGVSRLRSYKGFGWLVCMPSNGFIRASWCGFKLQQGHKFSCDMRWHGTASEPMYTLLYEDGGTVGF